MEIRSQEEYDTALQFLAEIGRWFWIGGSDIQQESNWVWDSNQEGINLNAFWASGRPYFYNTDINCLALGTAGMFDYYCSTIYTSVCKFD